MVPSKGISIAYTPRAAHRAPHAKQTSARKPFRVAPISHTLRQKRAGVPGSFRVVPHFWTTRPYEQLMEGCAGARMTPPCVPAHKRRAPAHTATVELHPLRGFTYGCGALRTWCTR